MWPQPFPILARLEPETGAMRLKTSVLLLPIVNVVEAAENIATLDHITHGRLDVGVAIGYREREKLGSDTAPPVSLGDGDGGQACAREPRRGGDRTEGDVPDDVAADVRDE